MAEEWRSIPSCRGYEASSEGRVRRGDRILNGFVSQAGYVVVDVGDRRTGAHRLVCEAFHGAPPPRCHAAHLDGSKANNRPDNLAWATPKENQAHRVEHGTMLSGESTPAAKLTEEAVREIWLSPLSCPREASKHGVHPSTVHYIRAGHSWGQLTSTLPPQPDRTAQRKRKIPVPHDARAMRARGSTAAAIAKHFGVSEATARRWGKEA